MSALVPGQNTADKHVAALAACGYGKTAEEYIAQWYEEQASGAWEAPPEWADSLEKAGVSTTITVAGFDALKTPMGAMNAAPPARLLFRSGVVSLRLGHHTSRRVHQNVRQVRWEHVHPPRQARERSPHRPPVREPSQYR